MKTKEKKPTIQLMASCTFFAHGKESKEDRVEYVNYTSWHEKRNKG